MPPAGVTRRHSERKAITRRLVPLLFLTVLLLGGASTARAQVVDAEDGFQARIAQERASAGRPALTPMADLQAVARRQAQRMADEGKLAHNPNLQSEVQGWSMVAENVGYGPDVDSVHDMFMASSSHRSNILSPDLTEVGVGVVRSADGQLWVAEVFRRPAAAPAPAPAAPPPAPPSTIAAPPVPTTAAPTTTVAPPAQTTSTTAAPTASTTTEAIREVALSARPSGAGRAVLVRAAPAPALPVVEELVRTAPGAAWAAAFLLAAVVGLQGQVLRRLGLLA